MEGKGFEEPVFQTRIQKWAQDKANTTDKEGLKLQEIFYDMGLKTSPICVIGSQKTELFKRFKKDHSNMCFNPEKYNFTTDFVADEIKIRITSKIMNLINASFIKGVIESKRSVVCAAYLGHSSYVEKAKTNQLSEGTLAEIVLLLAGGYEYTSAPKEEDFKNDDIKQSLTKLNGYEVGKEIKLFGVFRYDAEKATRLEPGKIPEKIQEICLKESERLKIL